MARGSGLPIPKGREIARPARDVSHASLSTADDWARIASVGAQLKREGADILEKERHEERVSYLAGEETDISRKRAELRNSHAENPNGFDNAWSAYTEGKLKEAQPWAIPQIEKALGRQGNSAYSAILNETRAKQKSRTRRRMNALLETSELEVMNMALDGQLETPEGKAAMDAYKAQQASAVTAGIKIPEEVTRDFKKLEMRMEEKVRSRDIAVAELVKDDLASIANSGQPLDLNEDRIERSLGQKKFADWQLDRRDAMEIYENTADMSSLTIEGIEARVTELTPEPGSPGFDRQQRVHDKVSERADEIAKLRRTDPAASVDDLPVVQQAIEAAMDGTPESTQALIDARIGAQASVGIPEFDRMPLTRAEAKALAKPVITAGRMTGRDDVSGGEQQIVEDLVDGVVNLYGSHAERVLPQVIEATTKDRQLGPLATSLFKKLVKGEPPTPSEAAQVETQGEATDALAAVSDSPADTGDDLAVAENTGAPVARKSPPITAIMALTEDPRLADQFDDKYGEGAAENILKGPVDAR